MLSSTYSNCHTTTLLQPSPISTSSQIAMNPLLSIHTNTNINTTSMNSNTHTSAPTHNPHNHLHTTHNPSNIQLTQFETKHIKLLQQLHLQIEQLNTNFQKQVQKLQQIRLQQFKDELIKTRNQFDQINYTRSDGAIKKNIYMKKKMLDRECALFLEKSMEMSKMYEGLKQRVLRMGNNQQELQNQIQYLHKQIRVQKLKKDSVEIQLKNMQQWYQKYTTNCAQKKNNKIILGQRSSNTTTNLCITNTTTFNNKKYEKDPKQIQKMMNQTKKWQQSSEKRLKQKIQNTKQFISSIAFEQSTIQQMFSLYDPQSYKQDKKKLQLMQSFLQQDHVKRKLYYLLFQNGNK